MDPKEDSKDSKDSKESKMNSNEIYSKKFLSMGFSTKAIHCGQQPEPNHGGVSTSIDLSSTFAQELPGVPLGKYDYSRAGNPTRTSLELQIAALEGGKFSQIFSSGLAATSACINLLKQGDEVLCIDDVYGGTQRLFRTINGPHHGVEFKFLPINDLNELKQGINDKTKMVWIESPTNPTLKVTDIREAVNVIKDKNKDIIVVVDNTFLSPFNCQPLSLGADIVVESGTKYLGGHSDVIMGLITTNCEKLNERLYYFNKCIGAVPSPFDCYLMIRGLKTLSLRMERINENAEKVANFLLTHKKVENVIYPGLTSNKYYDVQKKQLRKGKGVGFGGVISVYIKGGKENTFNFVSKLKVWTLAESLGAVESLVNVPAFMTHTSVKKEIREELGITENFIRLSTGIEDVDDLTEDLNQALNSLD